MKSYTAKSKQEAWDIADRIFPTDYMKNDILSNNAGYPIYESTLDGNFGWISDLNTRLEVNVNKEDGSSETTMIFINEEDDFDDFEVEVKSGSEIHRFKDYKSFRNSMRFWFSGMERHEDNESIYEEMMMALRKITMAEAMTCNLSGLMTTFIKK